MLNRKMFFVLSLLVAIVVIAITMNNDEQHKLQLMQQLPVAAKTDNKQPSFSVKTFAASTVEVSSQEKNKISTQIKNLAVPFTANHGQTDEKVKFYASTFGGTVFVTGEGEIVYSMQKDSSQWPVAGNLEQKGRSHKQDSKSRNPEERYGIALKESLVGGRINNIKGQDEAITKVSDFRGNDSSKWKSNIPTYDFVTFGEVYDGIELKLRAYGDNVEKLFFVKPEAAPQDIQVKLEGAKSLRVNEDGQLVAETEHGDIRFTKPVAYQETIVASSLGTVASQKQNRKYVEVAYVVDGDEYGFKVGEYDRSKELIIDPLLASTFLGGKSNETAYTIALDGSGYVYVSGMTTSTKIPTIKGDYDTSYNGGNSYSGDVFISKLSADLTTLLASTFLGGSDADSSTAISIDTDGNIFVTGTTLSPDFPITSVVYDSDYNDDTGDIFISKLNGDLTTLLASTYLGGHNYDLVYAMTTDPGGNVYVAGHTWSEDFPVTVDAFDPTYGSDPSFKGYKGYVSKINGDLTSLLASTYIGGTAGELIINNAILSMALDSDGNVYIAGGTTSTDFPTTIGAYDTSYNDDSLYGFEGDAFISKLSGDLTTLIASTFLGGVTSDVVSNIAIDAEGNIFAAGKTWSPDFPATINAYKKDRDGIFFISKLNRDLTSLLASTSMGGYADIEGAHDDIKAMTLDPVGNVYVAGYTLSSAFTVTAGAYDTYCGTDGICNDTLIYWPSHGQDAFISRLSGDLTTLLASTYLGGSKYESVYGLAVDKDGNLYAAGGTSSSDFPTTGDAYDTKHNNYGDAFVVKFDPDLSSDNTGFTLEITKSDADGGKVVSKPVGISCGAKCEGRFIENSKVALIATPSTGYGFQEWGGVCSGKGKCIVKMDADKDVSASFKKLSPEISVSPTAMSFREMAVGAYKGISKILRIINKGKGILTASIAIDSDDFSSGWEGKTITILPKSSQGIGIIFWPTSTGPKTATLTITSDDPETPTQTVTLKGTGK